MSKTEKGYCECGCGQKTRSAPRSMPNLGWIKGQPIRFVNGHQSKMIPTRLIDPSDIEDRFWSKIDKNGPILSKELGSCWIYTEGLSQDGYGKFAYSSKKSIPAHIFAYELLVHLVPENTILHHICEIKSCCNPDHLEEETRQTHMEKHSKLSSGDVEIIRSSSKSKWELSTQFDISVSHVTNIRNGHRRK